MQIVVFGMHRSGSSVLTRLLNMMGAYLSPEDKIMRPKPDNPKGFWEREDVYRLNERILTSGGGSWFNLVDFDWNRIAETEASAQVDEIRHILAGMDANRPWVMKDPRICVTFPAWRPMLDVPIGVHIYRSPLAIARSLNRRNGFPIGMGIGLWELYTIHAMEASRGLPKISIRQTEMLSQPVATVQRLFDELESLGVRGLRLPNPAEITAFIDPSLFHHHESRDEENQFLNQQQHALARQQESGRELAASSFAASAGGQEAQRLYLAAEEVHKEKAQLLIRQHELEQLSSGAEAEHLRREKALEARLDASSERERRLRQQERSQTQRISALEDCLRRISEQIAQLEQTRRWKTCSGIWRLVDSLLLRPKTGLSMESVRTPIEHIMKQPPAQPYDTHNDR